MIPALGTAAPALLALLFVATIPAAGLLEDVPSSLPRAPAREAQPGPDVSRKEMTIPDAEGDVALQPANPSNPVSASAQAVDIREVRVFGETGEVIRFSVKMANLQAEQDNPARPATQAFTGAVHVYVCFSLAAKNYVAEFRYRSDLAPIRAQVGHVDKECTTTGGKAVRAYENGVEGSVIADESKVELLIHRQAFAALTETDPPTVGDEISNVRAIVRDGVPGAQIAGAAERGTRFDSAPDAAPSPDVLPLIYPTSNQEVKMALDAARPLYRRCGDSRLLPTYEIEAGGMRGVPMAVLNYGGVERVVTFEVAKDGAPAWNVRMLPGVALPAGSPSEPGNLTVNVLVQTPPATKHKDCATIRVRAVDSTRSDIVGEASVNAVAIVPPSPERNTFYAHASGGKQWLNLQPDDGDRKDPIYLSGPATGDPLTVLDIEADAKSVYDLVVNTSAAHKHALVALAMRSEGIPTRAMLTAYVLTNGRGSDVLGTATTIATVGSERTDVKIEVPIEFTRDEFADGDPSRIISGQDHVRLYVQIRALGQDDNTHQVPLAGRLAILPDGTTVQIPIWETIKRNVNEPGSLGAFITLRTLSPPDDFANPGAPRSFGFTVRNEGATTDVAVVDASLSGLARDGWTAAVEPPGPFELAPGSSRDFTVSVTPPLTARESESVLLRVIATSQSDPSAQGTTAIKIVATQAQDFAPDDAGGPEVPTKKKGFVPAMPAFAVFAVLTALAWVRPRKD